MRKIFYTIFFLLLMVSSANSQNETLKSLVEKSADLNLDMWELVDYAKENIEGKQQLSKFFYYWITSNITYDYKSLNEASEGVITIAERIKRQNEYTVFENRKGVCEGYANLYKWFMEAIEVDVVIITGYIRDDRNHYVDLKDNRFAHGWNAIRITEDWILVDPTWGASKDPAQIEFYYDMKPEWAIKTHYPTKSHWQLLDDPLSLEEFNNSTYVNRIWFLAGFSDIPKLMADQEYYYYVFQTNPNENWSINLKYSSDNLNFNPILGIEPINQDGFTYYRFDKSGIPEKAFIKVNLSKLIQEETISYSNTYEGVINFKL